MKKTIILSILFLFALVSVNAQDANQVEMADALYANGKIYIVAIVAAIVIAMLSVYVILILNDKLTVQVPTNRVKSSGLRHLSTVDKIYQALELFKSKSKANRALWSKRAQEYEGKINSGNIFSIAEVLRDLHKNSEHPERSYSERAIYESAFFRLAKEISLVKSISLDTAKSFLANNLSQNDYAG